MVFKCYDMKHFQRNAVKLTLTAFLAALGLSSRAYAHDKNAAKDYVKTSQAQTLKTSCDVSKRPAFGADKETTNNCRLLDHSLINSIQGQISFRVKGKPFTAKVNNIAPPRVKTDISKLADKSPRTLTIKRAQ